MRYPSYRIGNKMFLSCSIIMTITFHGVIRNSIFLGHRNGKGLKGRIGQRRRKVLREPYEMGFTRMNLVKPISILARQFLSQGHQPLIISQALSRPSRTRMMHMTRTIAWFLGRMAQRGRLHVLGNRVLFLGLRQGHNRFAVRQRRITQHPMSGIQ